MSYTYLAIAYSGREEESFDFSMVAAAHYFNAGVHVYSPIAHCHPIAKAHSMPTDFDFWKNYNHAMIKSSNEVHVLVPPGWEVATIGSIGVQGEFLFALGMIPIRICLVRERLGVTDHPYGGYIFEQILKEANAK